MKIQYYGIEETPDTIKIVTSTEPFEIENWIEDNQVERRVLNNITFEKRYSQYEVTDLDAK